MMTREVPKYEVQWPCTTVWQALSCNTFLSWPIFQHDSWCDCFNTNGPPQVAVFLDWT